MVFFLAKLIENYISSALSQSERGLVGIVYEVTAYKTENGEFTVDKHNAIEGEVVTISVKLNKGLK